MSFDRVYEKIVPAPIEEQIKAIEREICVVAEINKKKIAAGKINPVNAAIHLHRMRSILVTLRSVRDAQANPIAQQEPPSGAVEASA